VAAISSPDHEPGPLSAVVEAAAASGEDAPDPSVTVTVQAGVPIGRLPRPWWMIGSERLAQLEHPGAIGGEFAEALRLAVSELGATAVRAHAMLHDEVGVYREVDGRPVIDFSAVDRLYDRVLDLGCRPIVELSFMPRDLAREPTATVFAYGAIISPPHDWDRWAELAGGVAAHLVERYGIDEVAGWGFEVWNEPNLEVFWTGSQAEYFRLYETAVRAIKAVDDRLPVGGPATAAVGWIPDFLDFVEAADVPLDFVSTHAYGIPPLDIRRALAERALDDVSVWWTEWGVTPTHFAPVNDSPFGAPFLLRGIKAALDSADALAYWVVSDHFEELGRPPRLLHGGFGLLTVGNLRKPRYWALALANQLGADQLGVGLEGDGAGSLVDGLAARAGDGSVDVLLWNGTLDQSKVDGEALLGREVRVHVDGLAPGAYRATLARVDDCHSNIAAHWSNGDDWPDEDGWARLRAADRLWEEPLGDVEAADGRLEVTFALPMPGVARLRLASAETDDGAAQGG
jgi:xylan 1,4-beta-xylosidase